jgi:hypothetical protein
MQNELLVISNLTRLDSFLHVLVAFYEIVAFKNVASDENTDIWLPSTSYTNIIYSGLGSTIKVKFAANREDGILIDQGRCHGADVTAVAC